MSDRRALVRGGLARLCSPRASRSIDSRSDRVVMEPNPTYWNPARRPTVRIVYDNVIGKDEGIKSVAVGDGQVDVVFDLTPDEAKSFPDSAHGRIQTKKAKAILTGVFNENRPDSPWRNPEARRAINLAIDQAFVLEHGAYGYGTVIPAFIQPGRYGSDPDMKPMPHDPEGARRTLDGLGLGGRELVFVASPAWKGVVDAIGQCLAKVDLGYRFVSAKDETPAEFDVKLEWYFDWDAAISGGLRAPRVLRKGRDPAPGSGGSEVRRLSTRNCCTRRRSRSKRAWYARWSGTFRTSRRPCSCSRPSLCSRSRTAWTSSPTTPACPNWPKPASRVEVASGRRGPFRAGHPGLQHEVARP